MASRLVFDPFGCRWLLEKIEDRVIEESIDMTTAGVHSRFCRNTIMQNLRRAADALEFCDRQEVK